MKYVLGLDQGTTSSRAILFDDKMHPAFIAQQEFEQIFPASGWVEHNPDDIWTTTLCTAKEVLDKAGISTSDIVSIGITNQRETTIIWDKNTGEPIYNAIVWQDRRTADICESLKDRNLEPEINLKTGLLLDPYFSGTKIKWLLDNIAGARENVDKLLFGTVDSFLIWKLTGGRSHLTDATNASRTMLYNIDKGCWDADICAMLDIPMNILPEVKDCAADFGSTDLLGSPIPIYGVAGDQQAATIGQACFKPGMMKSTYGTGCFALLNTGDELIHSKNRLLSTIAYQLDGKATYALEGSIFIAGAVVQWLRDGLKIINHASDSETLAINADEHHKLYMVPAFTGLGAPYWDAQCRGAIFGLTRSSGHEELCRAALESVGYQTRDLLEAMKKDIQHAQNTTLRVDGGMTSSNWAMQFLSDILDAPIDRPTITETTALGAAWLAGMRAGFYPDQGGFSDHWELDKNFAPNMDAPTRDKFYAGWQDAVSRTLSNR
ncbi:MAG: glycerol kinase GlpK [Kordiimonadaceae bacterium]|nr:glycerol kinase GlpK [Kordiimonadaceae bacterium]MBT6328590.1 glycerol kinase GlpK [Kordiimonadaceae bacterium]MBT7582250.1 glycerol kinase GlpK [Kordiimonadaceae bacterium]